jgi:hypothetical protein
MFMTRGHDNNTAMSSHGHLKVFTACIGTSTAMSIHGQLNVFTWGHDTSNAMSSHGKLNVFTGIMTIVLQ